MFGVLYCCIREREREREMPYICICTYIMAYFYILFIGERMILKKMLIILQTWLLGRYVGSQDEKKVG